MFVWERKGFYAACSQTAKFQLKLNQKTSTRAETKCKKNVWLLKKLKQQYKKKKPQKLKQKQTKPKKSNQTKATQKNPNNKNNNNNPPKPTTTTTTTAKPAKNTR